MDGVKGPMVPFNCTAGRGHCLSVGLVGVFITNAVPVLFDGAVPVLFDGAVPVLFDGAVPVLFAWFRFMLLFGSSASPLWRRSYCCLSAA
jgi:hypothetical protein